MKHFAIICAPLVLLVGCGQTYEDCILKHMKEAQTQNAAMLIRKACEDKHRPAGSVDWEQGAITHPEAKPWEQYQGNP